MPSPDHTVDMTHGFGIGYDVDEALHDITVTGGTSRALISLGGVDLWPACPCDDIDPDAWISRPQIVGDFGNFLELAVRDQRGKLPQRPGRADIVLRGNERHRDGGVGKSTEQVGFVNPLHKRRAQRSVNGWLPVNLDVGFLVPRRLVGLGPGAVLVQSVSSDADHGLDSVGVIQRITHRQIRAQEWPSTIQLSRLAARRTASMSAIA
jgi:hypothetical protein